MSFDVDPSVAELLVGLGSRFRSGPRISVRGDRVVALIPAYRDSPPVFSGQVERGPHRTTLEGVIRESRADRFLPHFGFALGLFLLLLAGLVIANESMTSIDGFVQVIVYVFSAVGLFVISPRIASKREALFKERAGLLENSLRDWLASQK